MRPTSQKRDVGTLISIIETCTYRDLDHPPFAVRNWLRVGLISIFKVTKFPTKRPSRAAFWLLNRKTVLIFILLLDYTSLVAE